MTSDLTRTALPLLAAILLAGAAASQQTDPRLERLDAGTRPIVAALVDSAHRALLPTEPLVQRALEGATKRASGDVIVAAVRHLAVAPGRARDGPETRISWNSGAPSSATSRWVRPPLPPPQRRRRRRR